MPPDSSLPFSSSESSSGESRRRMTSSPEFEFWRGHHHVTDDRFSQAQPIAGNLLSADELFVDGVILPLQLLPRLQQSRTAGDSNSSCQHHCPLPKLEDEDEASRSGGQASSTAAEPSPASIMSSSAPAAASSSSKRWKDLFRGIGVVGTGEKKAEPDERKRRRERTSRLGSSSGSLGSGVGVGALAFGGTTAELKINIWPFSRSRSSGTSGGSSSRHKGGMASWTAGRKVSSAPCSRSNSRGESSWSPSRAAVGCRRWGSSPGRGGIHVGRGSPVWQIRKGGVGVSAAKKVCGGWAEGESGCRRALTGAKEKKSGVKGGKLVVGGGPAGSCREEEKKKSSSMLVAEAGAGSRRHSFNLRVLFSRKVY